MLRLCHIDITVSICLCEGTAPAGLRKSLNKRQKAPPLPLRSIIQPILTSTSSDARVIALTVIPALQQPNYTNLKDNSCAHNRQRNNCCVLLSFIYTKYISLFIILLQFCNLVNLFFQNLCIAQTDRTILDYYYKFIYKIHFIHKNRLRN